MGNSVDWQQKVINQCKRNDITFLNPRRKDWNNQWIQEIGDNPFTEQVEWELEALDTADLILMYLAPGSKSPISLLEIGLYAKTKKLIICCPKGFWRKGNIDIVCRKYEIRQLENLDDFQAEIDKL